MNPIIKALFVLYPYRIWERFFDLFLIGILGWMTFSNLRRRVRKLEEGQK